MGYIANYGYADGSGTWYVIIDSGKCDGCGKCVEVCKEHVFEVITDDYDDLVATVKQEKRKSIKYLCNPCISTTEKKNLPCYLACEKGAIAHSW